MAGAPPAAAIQMAGVGAGGGPGAPAAPQPSRIYVEAMNVPSGSSTLAAERELSRRLGNGFIEDMGTRAIIPVGQPLPPGDLHFRLAPLAAPAQGGPSVFKKRFWNVMETIYIFGAMVEEALDLGRGWISFLLRAILACAIMGVNVWISVAALEEASAPSPASQLGFMAGKFTRICATVNHPSQYFFFLGISIAVFSATHRVSSALYSAAVLTISMRRTAGTAWLNAH